MKGFKIGCGQITWFAKNVERVPEEVMLQQISRAGYEGVPAGHNAKQTPEETMAFLSKFNLKPAPTYFSAQFWDKNNENQILARAREIAAYVKQLGCTELYVAADGFDRYKTVSGMTRNQLAGHVRPEDMMPDSEFRQFASTITAMGQITLEYGVSICFHNHAGSTIETREEIDKLFSLVDRKAVFLGPDTGHLAWAGVDVVKFFRDYAGDIKTAHVKDINPAPFKEGVEKKWSYGEFTNHGLFAELGEGFVDFRECFTILQKAGFNGWIIVETDVTQKPTPEISAAVSRNYLKSIGY